MAQRLKFDPIAEARRHWGDRWDAGAASSMSAVTSIMRTQQIVNARLNELLKPFSLSFPRYEALMLLFLSSRGALPIGKMGTRLQVHRTSVTNLVDGLEADGLVRRAPHGDDRRTTLVAITSSGSRTAQRATKVLNEARFGMEPMGDDELDHVTELLERFRREADQFDPGPIAQ